VHESQKKARQASSCMKNISSQGVPSSRRIFDSAAVNSGPKALVEGVRRQRLNKWWLLHVTTCHPTRLFRSVFNRKRHGGGPLSDCSPNLSTCDFSLFLEMKMLVKGAKMGGGEIPAKSKAVLESVTRRGSRGASRSGTSVDRGVWGLVVVDGSLKVTAILLQSEQLCLAHRMCTDY